MGKKPQKTPLSFFKIICRDDFTRLIRLPLEFVRKYGSNFPKKVILRIESGRTWDVKVERMEEEDGLLCFSRGWDVFSNDIDLKFGEFLVFVLDNRRTFDVYVFETSGCLKEFHDDDDDDEHSPDDDELTLDDNDVDDEDEPSHDDDDDYEEEDDDDGRRAYRGMVKRNPLYYEVVLKPHNKYLVTLKRGFTRAAGLMGKEGVKVVGKHYSVYVRLNNTHKDKGRIDFGDGWLRFRKINGIVFGKTYSFEFKPNQNLIRIKRVIN